MYLALKLIHILAVVAFLGNITTGVFWKMIADRTGRPDLIEHTVRGITLSDRLITIPSIIVIVLAGLGAAIVGGWPILGTGWILWSLILFIIAGIAFGPVSRAQREMAEILSTRAANVLASEAYLRASARWQLWGTIATIAPLIAVAFMVLKPSLIAFHH